MSTNSQRNSISFLRRPSSIPREAHDSMFVQQTASNNFLNRLRARKQSIAQQTITPADAVWYLSLPDKVKRQHFTKEEQILIRAKSEQALIDITPEVLAQVEELHHSSKTERSKSFFTSEGKVDTSPLPSPSLTYAPMTFAPTSTIRVVSPPIKSPTFGQNFMSPQYTAPPSRSFLRSPSVQSVDPRDMAQSNVSILPGPECVQMNSVRSTSQPVIGETFIESTPSPLYAQGRRSTSLAINRAAGPPKALYLGDPSTKALLKSCLSKDRFQETLIFGFPSASAMSDSHLKVHNIRPDFEDLSPGTAVRNSWLDSAPFTDLHEETSSKDGEMSSIDEMGPSTPTSAVYSQNSAILPACYDEEMDDMEELAAIPPNIPRSVSNTAYFEELMSRDMTLRMTLTKPELRASDEELYGPHSPNMDHHVATPNMFVSDPLALERLVFSEDTTGSNGVFGQYGRRRTIKSLLFNYK